MKKKIVKHANDKLQESFLASNFLCSELGNNINYPPGTTSTPPCNANFPSESLKNSALIEQPRNTSPNTLFKYTLYNKDNSPN